jgi:hypothetical protein
MLTPAELRRRALEILVREMGYADAMRFMHLFELGEGDYTRERDAMLPPWSGEELLRRADVQQRRHSA